MMILRRPLFWLLVIFGVSMLRAEGPIFRHKDGKVDQEFEQVYQDLRGKSPGILSEDADASGEHVRYDQLHITEWTSFTPTGGWNTNVTYTGKWRRVGDTMQVQFKIACTGAPNNAAPTIVLPDSNTIDTAKLLDTNQDVTLLDGHIEIVDTGSAIYVGQVLYNDTSSIRFVYTDTSTNPAKMTTMGSNTAPITFANGDYLLGWFSVPISGWEAK